MRELNGTLRGLLKKSNRPSQGRTNRVVFDESKNEFFEADYIILIREDCGYSEEDEEPCSCGEHELVRICCEDGCQCNYIEDSKSAQSPKFAPPIGFVDEAALSPPDGYKDNGLKTSLASALGGHVFGAQHIQQLQVIQKLQQQRAAMLAARASSQTKLPNQPAEDDAQSTIVCTECAECAECSTKVSPSIEILAKNVDGDPNQVTVSAVGLLPIHNNSPERRITQKEIIAGEERPKYIKEEPIYKDDQETPEDSLCPKIEQKKIDDATIAADIKEEQNINMTGILKGGKLWKQDENQVEESPVVKPIVKEIAACCKRSVRFLTENESQLAKDNIESSSELSETDNVLTELIPIKKHSSLFNNALRPNSAVRQLFPSVSRPTPVLTHEALRAFDESKRSNTLISDLFTGSTETDAIRKTVERNTLRRSLLRKKIIKSDTSLEERIKLLTCDIEETIESTTSESNDSQCSLSDFKKAELRKKPIGEENVSIISVKNFSPTSSASSSSSGSSQIYKKNSDKPNNDLKLDKNHEEIDNPVIIIPQDCRCPAAPDLGIGAHVPVVHTQIHQTPLRQAEIKKQFLSTLAPLTSCVAGQKDDLTSYYTLAGQEKNLSIANNEQCLINNPEGQLSMYIDDIFKVAPDVIAGTPGQEREESPSFTQLGVSKSEKLKLKNFKESNYASSDDDEQNDYGFNKRPSVRGIKTKFDSSNAVFQEMQDKINQTVEIENSFKFYKIHNQKIESDEQNQCNKNVSNVSNTPNQNETTNWNYVDNDMNQLPNYYNNVPIRIQQTFQGHQESLMYQNCHSVTTEKHISRYARSPSRRPESPPPLRNYHQTMVLIPYNAETCSQFTTTSANGEHHIHRQNILEYQQVTQQTIRVPMGYAFPTMQLHLVTGREQVNQFAQYPRVLNHRNFNFPNNANTVGERGVPEGAASASITESQKPNVSSESIKHSENNINQSVASVAPDPVYYAMNV